ISSARPPTPEMLAMVEVRRALLARGVILREAFEVGDNLFEGNLGLDLVCEWQIPNPGRSLEQVCEKTCPTPFRQTAAGFPNELDQDVIRQLVTVFVIAPWWHGSLDGERPHGHSL